MRKCFFLLLFIIPVFCFAQKDSIVVVKKDEIKTGHNHEPSETKVFYSQKLINSNTVEVLPKGIMEFRVSHAFGDAGGSGGGIDNFFGLDFATDIRIGFQTGLTNRLNLITARARGGGGGGNLSELWELGLKYQILKQADNDPKNPFSLTIFVNTVASSMESTYREVGSGQRDGQEANFQKFSDRLSEVAQVMIARKFGNVSFQLTPTYVYRSVVFQDTLHQDLDDKGIFAIGAGARIPLTKKFILILDYFHPFRSKASVDALGKSDVPANSVSRPLHFYDPIGVGFEILTAGHVFHLNFTNATQLLENRFIPRTESSWGKGQFRWAFTISRNFTIFRDKKK
jgi:uncharacterized beta barrel domain-containing protein DUF5777